MFRKWAAEHPNFMTPHIIELIEHGNELIEISQGTGFNYEPIYGVTMFRWDGSTFRNDIPGSQMFRSLQTARQYAYNWF